MKGREKVYFREYLLPSQMYRVTPSLSDGYYLLDINWILIGEVSCSFGKSRGRVIVMYGSPDDGERSPVKNE